jgi:hypothetical protein
MVTWIFRKEIEALLEQGESFLAKPLALSVGEPHWFA